MSSTSFGYGVAVDAGSSGSRIYLYRWPINTGKRRLLDHSSSDNNSFTQVEKEAIFSEERTPGIDTDHGIDHLEELVSLTKAALPPDADPSAVPIYLGATAGMRIVDSAFEADVMSHVRSLLRSSGFHFVDDFARTISGEEEGVYDWLVANYLKNGNFPTPATAYGALDLGGASTQISFPTSTVTDDLIPLRIDNVEYPLYTQSFLYFGTDQARLQYDTKFATPTKSNPCYPTGYTDPDSNISGSSNWEECLSSVAKLFDETIIHRPPIDVNQRFIAMSAFVYTWDYMGLKIGRETEDLNALNANGRHICNLPVKQQIEQYRLHMTHRPTKRKTTKPHAQCFNAAFQYHLLSKGYGLPVSNTPIEIYYDIGGTKVQWALGLMLMEANKISSIFKESGEQLDIYNMPGDTYKYLFIISIVVVIMLTLVLGPYRVKRPSEAQESILPLKRKVSDR